MADNYQNDRLDNNDFVDDRKLPTGLNVLTILTIIGCVLGLLSSSWNLVKAKESFDQKDEVMAKMKDPNMPAFAKAMMPDPEHFDELMTKSYENRLPIFLLNIVAYGLCLFGALQMRKRKKQGYLLYLIGEVLPLLVTVIFIGTFALSGIVGIIAIGIMLLFILLYTLQRKHLIY